MASTVKKEKNKTKNIKCNPFYQKKQKQVRKYEPDRVNAEGCHMIA